MSNLSIQNSHSQPVCTCPHCNSSTLTRFGFDRGIQRYLCKTCQRTFKATAGKPVHGLHKKEKITRYLEALRKGMSVRKAAKYVGISKNTSFAWRHKFLSSLEAHSIIQTKSETSSAEIIQLEYSAKGRKKPPEKHTCPTQTIMLHRDGQLELHKLPPVRPVRKAARIFTESPVSFVAASPSKILTTSIKHSDNAIKVKSSKISQLLINEAKKQKTKLLAWMERFRGVASKYLQDYWNWYTSMYNLGQLKDEAECFYRQCTCSRSLDQYIITKRQ